MHNYKRKHCVTIYYKLKFSLIERGSLDSGTTQQSGVKNLQNCAQFYTDLLNVSWVYVQESGELKATSVFSSVLNQLPFSPHVDGSQNHLVKIKLDTGTSFYTSVIWWIYTSDFLLIMNKITFWFAKKTLQKFKRFTWSLSKFTYGVTTAWGWKLRRQQSFM